MQQYALKVHLVCIPSMLFVCKSRNAELPAGAEASYQPPPSGLPHAAS